MGEVLTTSGGVLGAMALALGASAFFSSAETAVFNLGPADVRQGPTSRRATLDLLYRRRPTLLVTILLANLILNILYFNLGTLVASRLARAGASGAAAAVPLLVFLVLVMLGEVVPKILAVRWPRAVARVVAAPLLSAEKLLVVPRWLLSALADLLTRLLVGAREQEGELTSAELEHLLEMSARKGHIAPDEYERLQSVLVLSQVPVTEIMVPRVSMVAFPLGSGRDDFLVLAARHRRNKIPVFQDSLDKVEGFLDLKEVLAAPGTDLIDLVRPVTFVPETTPVSQVMERFLKERTRLLVVVDEYGGTEGMVTHEDLVEAVVGDLSDESDVHDPPVISLGAGHFSVDAGMSVRTWTRLVGRRGAVLPVTTVGGLVTALLERLPRKGDEVSLGQASLRVISMRGRIPGRIEVRLLSPKGEHR